MAALLTYLPKLITSTPANTSNNMNMIIDDHIIHFAANLTHNNTIKPHNIATKEVNTNTYHFSAIDSPIPFHPP